ncbi:MAG: GNAT family N-acetyltransferase [Clostridiales bacterium]|nr:GNAT family N-acetyltransferase [Clostridiales bacterium]
MITVREPAIADSAEIESVFYESKMENFIDTLPPELLKMAKGLGMNNIMKDMARLNYDDVVAGSVESFLDHRNRCMIMEENGKIIGYCLASTEIVNNFGKYKLIIGIGDIYIRKKHRRKGLGSKLLKDFIDYMNKHEECSIISVLIDEQYNTVNAKLFEKNGFILEKLGYKLKLGNRKYNVGHTVRSAVPSDYQGYAKLMIDMYESFISFDENIYNGTEVVFSERYYLEELREPNCFHIVCEIDNDIAGICMFRSEENCIDIHTVSVAENYVKRGVATSLYHSVFNFAQKRGYSEIIAVVFAQNEASCKFHEHMMMRPSKHRYIYKISG